MGSKLLLYSAVAGRDRSHELLYQAATDYCRRLGLLKPDLSVTRLPSQKPHFTNAPHIHFSVSHSGDYWFCAIADQEVGLDIQQHKTLDTRKLARRYFTAEESSYVTDHPQDFFTIWTAKESYVKYTGSGIAGNFGHFSVIENGRFINTLNGVSLLHLKTYPNYSLCLCYKKPCEIHCIAL